MITQLIQPIVLQTPKGRASAVAIIDYGPDWDLQWITFLENTGECWTFTNPEVRQENYFPPENITQGQEEGQVTPMRSGGHNIGVVIANEMRGHEHFEPGFHQPHHYNDNDSRNVI